MGGVYVIILTPFSSLSSPLSTSQSLCPGTPPTAGQLRSHLLQKHRYYKRMKTFSLVHPTTILFDLPVFLPTVTPHDIDAVTQENSCSTHPWMPLEMIYVLKELKETGFVPLGWLGSTGFCQRCRPLLTIGSHNWSRILQ